MNGTEQYRCFCRLKPLLAVCGRDASTGEPFVHVRAYRQKRIYAEIVVTSGVVRIRCRDCLRWHTIRIVGKILQTKDEPLPETISVG